MIDQGKRAQAAGLHLRPAARHIEEGDLGRAGEHVVDHAGGAGLVRDRDHVEIAGAFGEIGHVVVRIAARPDRAVAHLSGIFLGVVDQFRHAFGVEILRRRHQEGRNIDHIGDRHHVLQIIDLEFLRIDDRRNRIGGDIADHQCVAVGARLHHVLHGDDAEGAGPVLDDHRLAEAFAHLVGEDTGDDIGRAARHVRHDDLDRFGRIFVLRLGKTRTRGQAHERQRKNSQPPHRLLPNL